MDFNRAGFVIAPVLGFVLGSLIFGFWSGIAIAVVSSYLSYQSHKATAPQEEMFTSLREEKIHTTTSDSPPNNRESPPLPAPIPPVIVEVMGGIVRKIAPSLHWILRVVWTILIGLSAAYLTVWRTNRYQFKLLVLEVCGDFDFFCGLSLWLGLHISGESLLSMGDLILLAIGGPMMPKLILFAILGSGYFILALVFAALTLLIGPDPGEESTSPAE